MKRIIVQKSCTMVTILILIDGFLQYGIYEPINQIDSVTILILIDGFLQSQTPKLGQMSLICHNPYFNRWFSAIEEYAESISFKLRHNPYFNRWFSAI